MLPVLHFRRYFLPVVLFGTLLAVPAVSQSELAPRETGGGDLTSAASSDAKPDANELQRRDVLRAHGITPQPLLVNRDGLDLPKEEFFLSKQEIEQLDKSARKLYEKCIDDKPKHQSAMVGACVELLPALKKTFPGKAKEQSAAGRACGFRYSNGCLALGQLLQDAGQVNAARQAWLTPACQTLPACKMLVFNSYAKANPPDIANAEKWGVKLCEEGDDSVCKALTGIGSHVDVAKIEDNRKERRLAELREALHKNSKSIDESDGLIAVAQALVNRSNGFMQTLVAKGNLKMYESGKRDELKERAKLMAEYQSLGGDSSQLKGGLTLVGAVATGTAMAANLTNTTIGAPDALTATREMFAARGVNAAPPPSTGVMGLVTESAQHRAKRSLRNRNASSWRQQLRLQQLAQKSPAKIQTPDCR